MTCNYDNPDEAIEDALKGDNRLIDLSVGDIYGGNYSRFSLGSELIASLFGKVKYTKNVNDVNKKDISRSLVTLFASAVSQMTAFISVSGKIDKIILVGNPFESLVLMQMFQVCTAMFSKNRVHEMFSDYSQYLEIIGMCVELDKTQLVAFDIEDEYKGLI
jgi:type II pantothenate kinase